MSTERDTARAVRSWLEDGVTVLPDRVLDGVLDQLPSTHQHRVFWRRRAFRATTQRQAGLVAAAVMVIALAAFNLGSQDDAGGPVSPSPGASGSARPSPSPTPFLVPQSLDDFPIEVTVRTPIEWSTCGGGPLEQSVCRDAQDGGPSIAVGFLIVDNVVVDPCNADRGLLDPPPGPTVDDLVSAISNLPGFTASPAREITVDGFAGKEFTIIAPLGGSCDLLTWATADRINGVSAGERNLIRVVDVDGTRVVITGAYHPDQNPPNASAEDLAEIEAIMDSVDFAPDA